MRPALDLARELEKVGDALGWANQHLYLEAASDAAAHLNTTVRPSPLAVSIGQANDDVQRLILELREEAGVPDALS